MIGLPVLLALAASAWPTQPACGEAHIQEGSLTSAPGDPVFPDLYSVGVAGVADVSTCTITLDRLRWTNMTDRNWCHTTVHEYGHLLGLGHSTEMNVMNPNDVYTVTIPACDHYVTRRALVRPGGRPFHLPKPRRRRKHRRR